MTLPRDTSPPQHPTLAENAAEQLHRAIVSGVIPAGSHLRLTELAQRLGMSMMPVREAVRRLESLGLVEVHPHRGAFVREMSREDFADTMEIRLMLERTAVERAARRFTEAAAAEAQAWLKRYVSLVEDELVVEARQAHTQFHFILYRASGSHWLVRAIEPVWRNSERYRFAAAPHEPGEGLYGEHEPILEACKAGGAERAGRALTQHLERAARRMAVNIPDPETAEES